MISLIQRVGFGVFWIMLLGIGVRGQQLLDNVPAELVEYAYPDLIIYDGKIVTMDDASLNNSPGTIFEAMALRGDRIQFLGSSDEILSYAGPQTQKIDLKGRTVVPGLMNTHTHLHNAAVNQWAEQNPQEVEAIRKTFSVGGRTFEELSHGIEIVIKEHMSEPLPGQWGWISLEGGPTGIGVQYLKQKEMSREQFDQLAPNLPVILHAHPAWLLNTAARDDFLRMYEIPPTDENEALALTIATTFGRGLVVDRYFSKHPDKLADVIEDYLSYQAPSGITTFSSHIVGLQFMPAYIKLVQEDRMPVRFAFAHRNCQQVNPDIAGCFLRMGDWTGLGDKYFWNIGMTLGGIDSGFPAVCTSIGMDPRVKAQEECLLQPENPYWRAIYTALENRYRYVVNHSIGDRAMDYVMQIMTELIEKDPTITLDVMRSLRVTADHCNFYPRPDQIPRMARLGMILSCDTAINRSTPWLDIYGRNKANWIAPINSLVKGGVMVTSERGVNLVSGEGPTMNAAWMPFINRENARGELIAPEEGVDRVTVLKMATVWASYYVLKEEELGTLEPGKFADFVVFNKDYFTVPLDEFPSVYPEMTVLGGQIRVLREEFARELGVSPIGHQINFKFEPDYEVGEPLDPAQLM